jgi:hypothetical protein
MRSELLEYFSRKLTADKRVYKIVFHGAQAGRPQIVGNAQFVQPFSLSFRQRPEHVPDQVLIIGRASF